MDLARVTGKDGSAGKQLRQLDGRLRQAQEKLEQIKVKKNYEMGITHEPHLIIMDEPTNHLDLPSIECLEKALADCPCGLLLVSHDTQFLDHLTRTRWHIIEKNKTAKGSNFNVNLSG